GLRFAPAPAPTHPQAKRSALCPLAHAEPRAARSLSPHADPSALDRGVPATVSAVHRWLCLIEAEAAPVHARDGQATAQSAVLETAVPGGWPERGPWAVWADSGQGTAASGQPGEGSPQSAERDAPMGHA
ncbi:MAG TPA: hypothetical protein PKD87_03895, partial [Burkholderiaceae bacterium]|nr:hypothetical protein [Burkholderiaceae bacterium]